MRKLYLTFFMLCAAITASAEEVAALIAVSADGSEKKYELSEVQNIEFNTNLGDPEMILNQKEAQSVNGIKCIKFGTMTALVAQTEAEGVAVYVFPNPVKDNLTLSGVPEGETINITTINGSLIKSTKETTINVSNLQQGIYLINVCDKHIKFIKR